MPRPIQALILTARTRTVLLLLVAAFLVTGASARASAATMYRGANVHSLQSWNVSSDEMMRELDTVSSAGANLVRVDVTWSALEPAKGHYSDSYLARLDAFFAAAQARGIKVLATVAASPSWASSNGDWNGAPKNPSDFGDIARYLTNRYSADMAAIEAWNEPNWNSNLVTGDITGTYAAMLKAFYAGAKQGNPNVDVLAGATAYADISFFRGLWANGGRGYYDGLSVHPYADGASPSDTSVTHSFIGQLQALHAAQQAVGDNTPIWVTEFGWPTGTSKGANTEQQSADYLQQAFSILSGLSYVRGATVYQLRDMGSNPADPEDNFGLLHRDFTPRPAYAAFKQAMQGAGGSSAGAARSGGKRGQLRAHAAAFVRHGCVKLQRRHRRQRRHGGHGGHRGHHGHHGHHRRAATCRP
jgi:hypothetical protein